MNALLYELHRFRVLQKQGVDPALPDIVPLETNLTPEVRQALVAAIEQFSQAMTGVPERGQSIEATIKRTLMKGTPSDEESTRLIGAFVEATTALQYAQQNSDWMKEHRRRLL